MRLLGLGILLISFAFPARADSSPCVNELMRSAQAGDKDAFNRLVGEVENSLYGFCFNQMRNREEARDLTQDVLLSMYRKRDQCHTSVWAWMYAIARNRGITVRQKWRIGDRYLDPSGAGQSYLGREEDPSLLASQSETVALFREAFGELPEFYQETATLFYLDGVPLKEIAVRLKIPEGTVKRRLFTIRGHLRLALGEYFSEDDF